MASTKKRKIINMSLIVTFVSLLFFGIGLGVYFFVKEKNNGLTVRQKEFGMQINIFSNKSSVDKLDLSKLNEDININDVVLYTDDYLVTYNQNEKYVFYGLKNDIKPKIHDVVKYDEVLAIYGNYALLSFYGQKKIVDLVSGEQLVLLLDVDFSYSDGYLLLKTTNRRDFSIYINGAYTINLSAVLIDVESNSILFSVSNSSGVIDVQLTNNYLIQTGCDATKIYDLEDLELVLSLENISEEQAVYNVESKMNLKNYYQTLSYSAYELNEDYILIERLFASSDNADVNLSLSNGSKQGYDLLYYIFDVEEDISVVYDSENQILRPLNDDLGDDYVAIIRSNIQNKECDFKKLDLTYYIVNEDDRGEPKLNKIISYDYNRYGKIVGFNGKDLITSGADQSTIINFKANASKKISSELNQKITLSNYDKAIVVSSVLGQKFIYNSKGDLIIDKAFDVVSPFEHFNAIGKIGNDFYFITNKGNVELIENFAQEFADYVLMGIDLYFTKTTNGYNVYNLKNELLFSDAEIKIVFNKYINKVIVNISGENDACLKISPINEYFEYVMNSNLDYVVKIENMVQNNNQVEDDNVDNIIKKKNIFIDEKSGGVGIACFDFEINVGKLEYVTDYNSLNDKQKALIPEFDVETAYVSSNKTLVFKGVYFSNNSNITVAVIKLAELDNAQNVSYMITMALKDTYLSSLSASAVNLEKESVEVHYYESTKLLAQIDARNNVKPANSLSGKGLTYLDETLVEGSRNVSYMAAEFDGGLVLSTGNVLKINLSLELRNIFVGGRYNSEIIKLTNFASSEEFVCDLEKVKVYILNHGVNKYLKLVANDGYVISGFKIQEGDLNTQSIKDLHIKKEININNACIEKIIELTGQYGFIKIKDLNVREKHSVINFYSDNELIGSELFFHGYGKDLVSQNNAAYYGFKNFERKLLTEYIPTKTGYDFVGYKMNGEFITDKDSKVLNVETIINNYTDNVVNKIDFVAAYEPKTYTMFYQAEAPISVTTSVKFGLKIESLFDIVNSSYNKPGYEFLGWFDKENGGNQYIVGETVYNKTEDTILYPRWVPKTYTLTFNANFSTYTNLNINEDVYNVGSALLVEDFASNTEGSIFLGASKNVVFNQTYGEMPKINGYNYNNQIVERYMLIGWFDQKEVIVNNGQISRGNQYFPETKVTVDSAKVLYAHYEKYEYFVTFAKADTVNNGNKLKSSVLDELIYGI